MNLLKMWVCGVQKLDALSQADSNYTAWIRRSHRVESAHWLSRPPKTNVFSPESGLPEFLELSRQ